MEPLPAPAVLALFDAIGRRWRPAVALGAGAGLREGEALGLTVARTDFLRRKIHVRQQAQRGALVDLKSRRRTAPSRPMTGCWRPSRRTWPGSARARAGSSWPAPAGDRGGEPFTDAWRAAVERAGLPKGTRFHDLRHFYASTLIAANLNPKVIQARLGHATISETMDTYGHLFPDSEDLGRGATDSALFGAREEQGRNRGAL